MVNIIIGRINKPAIIYILPVADSYNDAPLVEAEFWAGQKRQWVDLTHFNQCRLVGYIGTAGSANCVVQVKYSVDNGANFVALSPSMSLADAGHKKTSWADIPQAAKGDVLIALFISGGDGIEDPSLSLALHVV